jgi:hypothetical protein
MGEEVFHARSDSVLDDDEVIIHPHSIILYSQYSCPTRTDIAKLSNIIVKLIPDQTGTVGRREVIVSCNNYKYKVYDKIALSRLGLRRFPI